MDFIDIILLIAIFATYFIVKAKYTKPEEIPERNYPYRKKMLLTKNEYTFYNILKSSCDNANLIICPKVRMEDFIDVTDKENKQKYRGYIKSRHIDFLICDSKLHILAGIELDDSSHNKESVKQIDEFKNEVFKTINLPLYRVKTSGEIYQERINEILSEI